jgi:hypothetical protein
MKLSLSVAMLAVLLLGCGGGGGGGSAPAPPVDDGGDTTPPPPVDAFSFTQATEDVGLPLTSTYQTPDTTQEFTGGGLAAVDIDSDDDIDIYVMGSGTEPNSLYINAGDGTFTEMAADFGLDITHRGSGPTFADIDGDNDLDLFIGGLNGGPNYLLRNDGNGFTDVTELSGLVITAGSTMSAAFSDYDFDGDLDLFLSHWSNEGQQDTETLWRNRGDGTFESYSVQSGIAARLLGTEVGALPNQSLVDHSFTPNLSDMDGDGDVDLLMSADFDTSRMFFNNGDGTFTWAEDNEPVLTDQFGMGASVGDYDNDGDMDWFVTSVFGTVSAEPATGNRLYQNDGNGGLLDVSEEAGVRDGHWGWGSCFADFDNDGLLDIFHVNGWNVEGYTDDPLVFFHSNGDGTFTEEAISLRLADRDQGRGVACFDAERDGDLDIVIFNSSENKLRFYRNNRDNPNHYISIRLAGLAPNSHGVGAWITVETDLGVQVREVKSGSNFVSQNPTEVHFGLSTATLATVEVRWPDGSTTTESDVAADQLLTLTQPEPETFRVGVIQGSGSGRYEEGDEISITAAAPQEGYFFSHWSSSAGGEFAEAESATTTFTVPAELVRLTANYVPGVAPQAEVSVARRWSEVLLQAIRNDFARPTVHARNLFHISSAMYDSWSAYDDVATPWLLGRTRADAACEFTGVAAGDIEPARETALSYASYRLIRHRFSGSPGASRIFRDSDALMGSLGLSLDETSTEHSQSAAALGNHIADCYIRFGMNDRSNEANGYVNVAYEPVNAPLEPAMPGNPNITDLNRWQPLSLAESIDQSGNVVNDTPEFLGPEWGQVVPFALTSADLTIFERTGFDYWVYHDPGMPPTIDGDLADTYKWAFSLVSTWSSHLDPTDGVMVDISPASLGNIESYPAAFEDYGEFYPTFAGGDPSRGHLSNPVTGQPYESQMVPRGDYGRVLAEFWADGPDSETPPGHWFVILNEVNEHELLQRRYMGTGPELSHLEWDVKAYFALGGAMHDSAVTAWGIKGWYDYIRPISSLRAMADRGQSSDETLPSFHEDGILLYEGFIELVEAGDELAGEEDVNVGKIKLKSWRGPDFIDNPGTDEAGVGWILAENWWPYQRPSFVTPPFAGYISGHSTYSRAAAEVLSAMTGSRFFPGGMSGFEVKKNEFLVFEEGPSVDMTLEWATYQDAADQCSLSRIWGGIHPPLDDIPGRLIGLELGIDAFAEANSFFDGSATSP